MRRYLLFSVLIALLAGCASPRSNIKGNNPDEVLGIRLYRYKLPSETKYKFLGKVKADGWGGTVYEKVVNARQLMSAQASSMGANAVVNTKFSNFLGRVFMRGEAVKINELSSLPEEVKPETSTAYESSRIFRGDYSLVFIAAERVLESEFYNLKVSSKAAGVIEAEQMEVPLHRIKWAKPGYKGSAPRLKMKVRLERAGDKKIKVTQAYDFGGIACRKNVIRKYSDRFFKKLAGYLKNAGI